MDNFFIKTKCDRCGGSLKEGRIMSMFNTDCICMECKEKEKKLPGYEEACKKDIEEYQEQFTYTCCICGKQFTGFGNNAEPIKSGKCCDACNAKVIKARLIEIMKSWD